MPPSWCCYCHASAYLAFDRSGQELVLEQEAMRTKDSILYDPDHMANGWKFQHAVPFDVLQHLDLVATTSSPASGLLLEACRKR